MIEVRIVLDDQNQLKILAPVDKKIIVCGMLEMAKKMVMDAKVPDIMIPRPGSGVNIDP